MIQSSLINYRILPVQLEFPEWLHNVYNPLWKRFKLSDLIGILKNKQEGGT